MADLGVPCPFHVAPGERCPARLQAVMFEGRLLLSAGIAGHLQIVHGMGLQAAWHMAHKAAQ